MTQQMTQFEWIDIFKEINDREPTPKEFQEALSKGEFVIERTAAAQQAEQELTAPKVSPGQTTVSSPSQPTPAPTVQPIQTVSHSNPNVMELRKQIAAKDAELAGLYLQLGTSLYYDKINQLEGNYDHLLEQLIKKNQEVYYLRQDFNRSALDGKRCLSCHQVVAHDAIFCSYCGGDQRELVALDRENRLACEVCGIEQSNKNKFCACCGKEFEDMVR